MATEEKIEAIDIADYDPPPEFRDYPGIVPYKDDRGIEVIEMATARVTFEQNEDNYVELYQRGDRDLFWELDSMFDHGPTWAVFLNDSQVAGPFDTIAEANATAAAIATYSIIKGRK